MVKSRDVKEGAAGFFGAIWGLGLAALIFLACIQSMHFNNQFDDKLRESVSGYEKSKVVLDYAKEQYEDVRKEMTTFMKDNLIKKEKLEAMSSKLDDLEKVHVKITSLLQLEHKRISSLEQKEEIFHEQNRKHKILWFLN